MNPILLAISGPLKGTTFEPPEGEAYIGRDPTSSLCLADVSTSRKHCLVRKEQDRFTIVDLESRNGTFVNDIPVRESILNDGDRIAIGNSVFLFLNELSSLSPKTVTNKEVKDQWIARSTLELHIEEDSNRRPIDDRFDAILKISMAIQSIRDEKTLCSTLLDAVMEAIPASRGAILLIENNGSLQTVCEQWKNSSEKEQIPVSRTIANRVMEERLAILSNDVWEQDSLRGVKSLAASRITSLLIVPLMVSGEASGVLYLDSNESDFAFSKDDLQWLAAVASIGAITLNHVRHSFALNQQNRLLQGELRMNHQLIGESPAIQQLLHFIGKVAPSNSTILVCGESGTGKELVAKAFHDNSERAERPFVVVNCAVLSESLLESELFGHEKGSFTGAIAQKKGKLEMASGGTVFLDEIAELSPLLQAKLLRVLQEREFDRVGGTRPIQVDIRFIAATNKNLEKAIANGSFRQDLFYRLNVVSIVVPPLRERGEDISLLATFFAAKYCRKAKRRPLGISKEARTLLLQYHWPGNVRELENAIERAIVLANGDAILPEDLPDAVLEAGTGESLTGLKYYETIRETKKQMLIRAFEQAGANHNEAARILGIHPNNLHRLIRNLNLKSVLKSDS